MTKLPPLPKVHDLGGAEFEKLMHQLLLAYADHEKFDYEPHGKSGAADDGIDGLARLGGVPGLKGPVAFQFKWLTGNLSKGPYALQISEALHTATASEIKFNHYVVVTPENISPAQKKWLLGLSPRKDLKIHHWGHARLASLFRLSPDLLAKYYPEASRATSADKASPKLLSAYLDWLIQDSAPLKLVAVDQGAARSGWRPPGLISVYVDLELTLRIPRNQSLGTYLSKLPKELSAIRGRGEEAQRQDRRVPVIEALAHHPRLVLLGAPGSGKSTLAAYLALRLAEAARDRKKSLTGIWSWWQAGPMIPVRVVLREFAASLPKQIQKGRAQHLWDFLAAKLSRVGLAAQTAAALRQTASDFGALFLLDGLGDAHEASTRDRVLEAVTEFAATAGSNCRFLLTTRPYVWEQAAAAQVDWPVSYQLAEFSSEQTAAFITRWFQAVHEVGWIGEAEAKEKAANLLQAVQRSDIQPLASNPLLLNLMATLLANRYRLPDDRADLYDEVVKLLLQRWAETTGADRGLLDALAIPGLTLDHLREVMEQLAFAAHAAHPGQEGVANIHESELLAVLRPLLGDAAKAYLALDYIEKRAGLLLGQGPRGHERQYTFPHRTFQEYLAACWLSDQPDFCERGVVLARQNAAHWREVLTFAARQAKAGRGVPAADALVHNQPVEEWTKENQPGETDWRAAVLAGEQLLEIGLAAVNAREEHRAVRRRVAGWIGALLNRSGLPVPERAKAGVVLARLGDERKGVGVKNGLPDIDWIEIPPGPFKMGNNKGQNPHEDETPEFTCDAIQQPFAISRYPVTVVQYQTFVDAGGYGEKRFWTEAGWEWRQRSQTTGPRDWERAFQGANHPRVGVAWFEAAAFCRWLSELLRMNVALPSEAEWERAARHTDGRTFPWGEDAGEAAERSNMLDTGIGCSSAVGMFPSGAASCGAADMAGNVWEWTRSAYAKYPYTAHDGREDLAASREVARALRGGAWQENVRAIRCACRAERSPDSSTNDIGFRLAAPALLEDRSLKDQSPLKLVKLELINVRCFSRLSVSLPTAPRETGSPWTMVLGDNASGKTTLLRCIALGLCNESDATSLLKMLPGRLIRDGTTEGRIQLTLNSRDGAEEWVLETLILKTPDGEGEVVRKTSRPMGEFPWGRIFVCGYGTHRSGLADRSYEGYLPFHAVSSLFDPGAPLQNPENVLLKAGKATKQMAKTLLSISLLDDRESEVVLPSTKQSTVEVKGPWGKMPLSVLSDGYRSTAQWLVDFLGWAILAERMGNTGPTGGILLIDELEQHLHPRWQRNIVQRLAERLPAVQVIASTHTPLIAAAMSDVPEAAIVRMVLDQEKRQVKALHLKGADLRGKRADQVLTEIFELVTTRSLGSQGDLARLSELESKERTAEEEIELHQLSTQLQERLLLGENSYEQAVELAVREVLERHLKAPMSPTLSLETKRQLRGLFGIADDQD